MRPYAASARDLKLLEYAALNQHIGGLAVESELQADEGILGPLVFVVRD